MQLAAPRHQEGAGIAGVLHAQGDIVDQLLVQSLADLSAGDELALLTGQRRIVDLESHADGGLVDGQARQGLDLFRIAKCVGDAYAVDARDGDDVTGTSLGHFDPLQPSETQYLQDAGIVRLVQFVDTHDRHVGAHRAAVDAADADGADIARIRQRADLHLERAVWLHLRRRHIRDDGFEQRRHVPARLVLKVAHCITLQG